MACQDQKKMNILPIAVTPKHVLLIGAGKVAAQKARIIADSDCRLTIITKEVCDSYFTDKPILYKTFNINDFNTVDYDIVINATGDSALSKQLWMNRKRFHYWLNCVDEPQYCDFYFGATFRDNDLCVSVSTGGASPAYAQKIRDIIGACVPRRSPMFYRTLRARRKKVELPCAISTERQKVYLIGCGTGSIDHLTLQAVKTLPTLEVALIDALIGKEIITLLPHDCHIIDVGKRKGQHMMPQEEINALMLHYAQHGYRVGRLKGGDPAIFGRLFEEASFLSSHRIETELINGISSFLSGSLAAGIPPTLRDVATGALIVSAHLRESRYHDQWLDIVKEQRYTVVVLMAHSYAARIQESAKGKNVPLDISAAFVSKIDSSEQTTVIGTLSTLDRMATLCDKPAILIIGNAVAASAAMPYSGRRIFVNDAVSDLNLEIAA
jgi:uroporphyrin-III C-methyltransferase/precorrin-2 dehydrogenase/sirohydrochlorin ferrochelatase